MDGGTLGYRGQIFAMYYPDDLDAEPFWEAVRTFTRRAELLRLTTEEFVERMCAFASLLGYDMAPGDEREGVLAFHIT